MRKPTPNGKGCIAKLIELLGEETVLLPAEPNTKEVKRTGWQNYTVEMMKSPSYLEKLERSNVGVSLGPVSGNLITIDCDTDELADSILSLNPCLHQTLQTKGQRGRNFWLRMRGGYPVNSSKLKDQAGNEVGEWRAKGNYTIVSGIHPDGMLYTFVHDAKPLEVEFSDILWPEGIKHPHLEAGPELTEQQSNRANEQLSNTAIDAGCVLRVVVEPFLPTKEHKNNDLLFLMGRAVLAQEVQLGRKATEEELRAIFNDWYSKNRFLREGQSKDEYWMEFMEQYDNAKVPLDQNPVAYAWEQAGKNPYPPEADKFEDERYKRAVGLCHQLQQLAGDNPFYLSCRSLGAVMGVSREFANRFLKLLRKGPLKVVVEHTADRAARYRYTSSE